jgi:hypothetical protein
MFDKAWFSVDFSLFSGFRSSCPKAAKILSGTIIFTLVLETLLPSRIKSCDVGACQGCLSLGMVPTVPLVHYQVKFYFSFQIDVEHNTVGIPRWGTNIVCNAISLKI